MKIRSGFVSNSSSSSFIVVSDDSYDDVSSIKQFENLFDRYLDHNTGVFSYTPTFEFGWQTEKYYDMKIKFDWVMLTWMYCGFLKEHKDRIERFLKCAFRGDVHLLPFSDNGDGYIDHQSISNEVLESYSLMKDFILSPNSYIQNDNDNY